MNEKLSVATIAEQTDTNQKTIRAYLRRNHSRSIEHKNSRWGDAKKAYALSAKLTSELVERFTIVSRAARWLVGIVHVRDEANSYHAASVWLSGKQ